MAPPGPQARMCPVHYTFRQNLAKSLWTEAHALRLRGLSRCLLSRQNHGPVQMGLSALDPALIEDRRRIRVPLPYSRAGTMQGRISPN